ncbi:hypothetical protein [Rubrivivax gelatinosus]|uniref:Uncharacterized protein n=1 Tax=Rubrivivax gelatinosus (strain NBRC 100245 / IL144) TaxID=983917 RepID=I0HY11_RUBGI|nr:hypothetical protein [Rubrivivax gelatinosus]BAL97898.1 hypothetical protein RGE_45630 [Rubrivivax gelatinosus IL144]
MPKPWQQSLLSSGLPLESDLLAYLQAQGCVAKFHYSYLKEDELAIEREFSYDIDASYITRGCFMDLMVECKYRHPGTRWVFSPDQYGGFRELAPTDFLNPFDHFVPQRFKYGWQYPRVLGPVCSKGTELLADGANEKSIAQAIYQLAYAMVNKVGEAIESQVEKSLVDHHIFFHIPIIATTAEIYRIREGVRIEDIRNAKDLVDVATRERCVVLNHDIGVDLYRHNAKILTAVRRRVGDKNLKKALSSFTTDLDHLFRVLADHLTPRAIAVIEIGPNQEGMDRLFRYINDIVDPPDELLAEIEERQRKFEEMVAGMRKINRKRNTSLTKRGASDA